VPLQGRPHGLTTPAFSRRYNSSLFGGRQK
jgi:hypothetical protein